MNNKPERITIRMFGTTPLHNQGDLTVLFNALEQLPKCAPEFWSLDERSKLPFNRAEILEQANKPATERPTSIYLRRNKTAKYFGFFDMNRKPYIDFEFNPTLAQKNWPLFFEFVDALVHAFKPDIATAHIWPVYENDPWPTKEDKYLGIIAKAANIAPVNYYKTGPIGLTMRTYLGPHYIEQFGKELLLSTPGTAIAEQSWGGLRLDLSESPWALSVSELIGCWRQAMDHLTPAQIFAEMEITPKQRIKCSKGARCTVGGIINDK